MPVFELSYYQTAAGRQPFAEWLKNLNDHEARSRIWARLARVASGNLGDHRSVGEGELELPAVFGPGYRIYFSRIGEAIILLLCGGDKDTQQRDIRRAKAYLKDFKARSAKT
jgi:putative addiction module killer protein